MFEIECSKRTVRTPASLLVRDLLMAFVNFSSFRDALVAVVSDVLDLICRLREVISKRILCVTDSKTKCRLHDVLSSVTLMLSCLSYLLVDHLLYYDVLQAIQGQMDGLEYASLMRLQIFVGLGMIMGCLVFGFLVVHNSSECFISRQYLCQASCIVMSLMVFAFALGIQDYSGYVMFCSMYGFFYGGYSYSLKMFVFEKVRARNFNRAWGFLQFCQSLPAFFGIPITSEYLYHVSSFQMSVLSDYFGVKGLKTLSRKKMKEEKTEP